MVYRGVVPDIFGEGIQVVVEGRHAVGGDFQAQLLLRHRNLAAPSNSYPG